jgi:hypothetical protein
MNSTEIKVLLVKYFEAETSLAEEQQLHELFTSGDYLPEFESEAIVIQYADWEAGERKKDPEFEKELQEIINSIQDPLHKQKIRRVSWLAAATILLLAGLFFAFRHIHVVRERTELAREANALYNETFNYMRHSARKMNADFSELDKLSSFEKIRNTALDLRPSGELQNPIIHTNEKGSTN